MDIYIVPIFFPSDMFDKENHILVYSSLCTCLINSLRLIPRSEISGTKDLYDWHFLSWMTGFRCLGFNINVSFALPQERYVG